MATENDTPLDRDDGTAFDPATFADATKPPVFLDPANVDKLIAAAKAEALKQSFGSSAIKNFEVIAKAVLPTALNIAMPGLGTAVGGVLKVVAPLLMLALFLTPAFANERPVIEVLFTQEKASPQARIVEEINKAKSTITIQQYQLTAAPIIKALIDAHERGVKVVCVLDRSLGSPLHSGPKELHEAGVEIWFDCGHAIAHNKLAVIDRKVALGGSYNWSDGAERRNAENLDVIFDAVIVKRIDDEITRHKAHSKTYDEMKRYVAEKEARQAK